MIKLFAEGGIFVMSLLTFELIALLLAGWKAPGWVKEIGWAALVTGILFQITGVRSAALAVMRAGDISSTLIWGGVRVAAIVIGYALIIYSISLIIRITNKPRNF